MTLWKPPSEVSTKEVIGRRAFTSKLKNSGGQYKVDVFLDDRSDSGLSVDRLGVRKADPEVIAKLADLGHALGRKRGRPFTGWAQLRVSDIPGPSKLKVVQTEAEGEDNEYHAEIAHVDTGVVSYTEAFMLAVVAANLDFLEAPKESGPMEPEIAKDGDE